jgi:hypothetical protein
VLSASTLAKTAAASLAATALFALSQIPAAAAANPFADLNGSWSGGGKAKFEGGQTEKLRCTASYKSSGSGGGLTLSIRCASPSAQIALRGNLVNKGGKVSGTWEETAFNTGGDAFGVARGGSLRLKISGGVQGSISLAFSQSRQTVSISTVGVPLKSVVLGLRRR